MYDGLHMIPFDYKANAKSLDGMAQIGGTKKWSQNPFPEKDNFPHSADLLPARLILSSLEAAERQPFLVKCEANFQDICSRLSDKRKLGF